MVKEDEVLKKNICFDFNAPRNSKHLKVSQKCGCEHKSNSDKNMYQSTAGQAHDYEFQDLDFQEFLNIYSESESADRSKRSVNDFEEEEPEQEEVRSLTDENVETRHGRMGDGESAMMILKERNLVFELINVGFMKFSAGLVNNMRREDTIRSIYEDIRNLLYLWAEGSISVEDVLDSASGAMQDNYAVGNSFNLLKEFEEWEKEECEVEKREAEVCEAGEQAKQSKSKNGVTITPGCVANVLLDGNLRIVSRPLPSIQGRDRISSGECENVEDFSDVEVIRSPRRKKRKFNFYD